MESLGEILRRTERNGAHKPSKPPHPPDSGGRDNSNLPPESGGGGGESESDPLCPICHGAGYVRLDVPIGDPNFGRAVPCECQERELAAKRLASLLARSNIGALRRLSFANLKEQGLLPDRVARELFKQATTAAKAFAAQPEGFLVLTGPSGSGKTHMAAAVANAAIEAGTPTFFAIVPDLLDHLRSAFSPQSEVTYDELFQTVRNVPLLVLDDLGGYSTTPWAQEKLYQIINHRFNVQAPTVFTVGGALDDLPERLRTRLTDESLAHVVLLQAEPTPLVRGNPLELELLKEMTFEQFKPSAAGLTAEERRLLGDAISLAKLYAQHPMGWLVFTGPPGGGKTHLAAAIANYRLKQKQPVMFLVVPDLLDHLRAAFRPDAPETYDELFEQVRTTALLILDDLGAHVSTPWAQEKLYQVINYRYNARLPTVVTSNSLDDIEARQRSRLVDKDLSQVVDFKVGDYRNIKGDTGGGLRPRSEGRARRGR